MDETYAEDSFVVGSEVEELESSDEELKDFERLPEVSFVDGKKQYATRRRVFLHKARAASSNATAKALPEERTRVKTKQRHVIRVYDSSEEEVEEVSKKGPITEDSFAAPLWPKTAHPKSNRPQLNQRPSTSAATAASKVASLAKSQRFSVSEREQNQR